jgi:tRNA-modifying protein YgfZ
MDALLAAGLGRADLAAAEARRIRLGHPRFGFDLDAESLPAEAGLDSAPVTDRTKGCFLGQESIAKIANLGHPPRVVLSVRGARPLGAGDEVLAAGEPVGALTSAAGPFAIARVAWSARDGALSTGAGERLERVPPG